MTEHKTRVMITASNEPASNCPRSSPKALRMKIIVIDIISLGIEKSGPDPINKILAHIILFYAGFGQSDKLKLDT